MRSDPFGDVHVAYRELGEGPPLLLIHGLMTSSYSWRYVLRPLSKKYRVIAPDLPGSGKSSKVLGVKYSATAYARWIREFCAALSIRGTACVANSLGGYLAMRAGLADHQLFSRLVNIHSPGLPELRLSLLSWAMKLPGIRRALAWFIRRDPYRFVHRNVHYYHESLKSLEEARAYGEPLSTPEGARAFANILGDVLDPRELRRFVTELESRKSHGEPFPIPLYLIYARRDPMVPPRLGPRLHALIPGAKFSWLEDSSHFAHVDTPEAVLALIEPFLAS
jgi:pimeloyl-ACP methyl ester carboxylesterase